MLRPQLDRHAELDPPAPLSTMCILRITFFYPLRIYHYPKMIILDGIEISRTSYIPPDPFDNSDVDYVQPPPSAVGLLFDAPPPLGTTCSSVPLPLSVVGLSFDAPPPPGTTCSSVPHMPISRVSSSDSDEHGDDLSDDTIRPNISKERIHVLVEFEPIQSQTFSDIQHTHVSTDEDHSNIRQYVMTITLMISDEPSMLYPDVEEDDEDDDNANEDYTLSSASDDDNDDNDEEDYIITPINPLSSTTVNQ
ncbi:hypothetical protein M9H77_22787 [Catharanthus roseus]|uniref:Uncharacterized protein n=1 Tax=Catharanthus roseus TaxID=4058 RepID=A0ACC0ATM0_CATRO|nr:hypothetical protein M9H77_22787 [Catharanthus roseus]